MRRRRRETPAILRTRLLVALGLLLALVSCGGSGPVDHPAASEEEAAASEGESWWVLDRSDYRLVAGGVTPPEVAGQTGSLWMLEYAGPTHTVRLVADQDGGLFSELSAASPEVGKAAVDGVPVILREHPGRPAENVAPSVGAEWTVNGVFVSFGGQGLPEAELRDLLGDVQRVTRAKWEEATAGLPPSGSEAPMEELPGVPPAPGAGG